MPASFIVLEGPDGSGTTTQTRLLAERLRAEGRDVLTTAEPTAGTVGAWIRQILRGGSGLSSLAVQLLFCADRAEHTERVILPALAAGKTVLCDRYWHSTVAYAEAQGLDPAVLAELNRAFVQPNHVVFALPPLSVCMERMDRRPEKEIFEHEELQKKIHAAYRRLADADRRIAVVDTSGAKDATAAEIARLVA